MNPSVIVLSPIETRRFQFFALTSNATMNILVHAACLHVCKFLQDNSFQLGTVLPDKDHLAMFGDIFDNQNWGGRMPQASSG